MGKKKGIAFAAQIKEVLDLKLDHWSYSRKYTIKAIFTTHPHSLVIFRAIKEYYFIFTVKWDPSDPPVTRKDLEKMELLVNIELGTFSYYMKRKVFKETF